MANNDRVTKQPSPSWIPDNQSMGNPLATKTTNGSIGWNDEDNETRILLSRNAFDTPGWRAKKVIPPDMAEIRFNTSLFQVLTEPGGLIVPNGALVEKGLQLRVVYFNPNGQYGCRATITNGTVSDEVFLKNFRTQGASGDTPNSHVFEVIGNIQITGEARKRGRIAIGADLSSVITCDLEVNSWGDLGHQTKTLALTASLLDPTDMEFYEGDQMTFTTTVNSPYHWCNFRYSVGSNATMYPVPKSEVVFKSDGGTYQRTVTGETLYLAMGAVRPISFYLYQEGSTYFTNTKVRVSRKNSNLNLYTNAEQPAVNTQITYGRNGSAGNHVPLYSGMYLEIYCSNSSLIAQGSVVSYNSLSPLPSIPNEYRGAERLEIQIGNEANANGYMCVGLRYLKPRMEGNKIYPGNGGSLDTGTFEQMFNAAYAGIDGSSIQMNWGVPFFTDKIHLVNPNGYEGIRYMSETEALKLALVENTPFEWEFEQRGRWRNGSLNSSFGGSWMPEFGVLEAEGINIGPLTLNYLHAYILSINTVDLDRNGVAYQRCTIEAISDYVNLNVSGPTADWHVPDNPDLYIPYDALYEEWGDPAWEVQNNFVITPYFVAITRSA